MAYYCNRCRLAAEKRYANCPSCGGGLTQDARTCDDFYRMGYRIIGGKNKPTASVTQITPPPGSVHIRDDDTLARLRKGYQESLQQDEPQDDPYATQSQQFEYDSVSQENSGAGDFFSHYTNVTPPIQENQDFHREEPFVHIPPEPLPTHNQHIRPDFSGLCDSMMALLRAIPWRLVFILLILAGIVGVVMTIWNMRYVIVNSLLGFLIELIPVFLIIGGIVYLIKSIFR